MKPALCRSYMVSQSQAYLTVTLTVEYQLQRRLIRSQQEDVSLYNTCVEQLGWVQSCS